MELRVLGCHGGETPQHRTSSFLVDGRLAIDAGAVTTMLTLEEQHRIEAVLVSHAHMDHIKDLATLADNRCQQGGPPLLIAASGITIGYLKQHFFNDLIWPDFSKIYVNERPTIAYQEVPLGVRTEVAGMGVTSVAVHHTIDTNGFLVDTGSGSIAYSGDTGPTEDFWELLSTTENLKGLLMEVSFPNEEHALAKASGHHTPETLHVEFDKLRGHRELPILLYHIKPVFEAAVERQLTKLGRRESTEICRLGNEFIL